MGHSLQLLPELTAKQRGARAPPPLGEATARAREQVHLCAPWKRPQNAGRFPASTGAQVYLPTCAPRTATIYLQTTDVSGCGGWGSSVWAPLVPEPLCPHLRPARNLSALHQHARRVARKRPSRWPVPVGPSVRGPMKSASLLLSKTQGGGLSSPGRCPGSRDRVVQSLRSSAARGFLDAGPPPSDILRGSFQKYMIRTLFPNAAAYELRGNSAPPAQRRGGSVTAPQEARV